MNREMRNILHEVGMKILGFSVYFLLLFLLALKLWNNIK